MTQYEKVQNLIVDIKKELKSIGCWQNNPLEDSAYIDPGPFGVNTMTSEQWLQFVFIPNVERMIKQKEPFPDSSFVGVWAVKNFDGFPESERLLALLSSFDQLIHLKN